MFEVQKVAEWPVFSPRTPSRVISLIGPDRDLFLKGRRAEIDGLGIGAFAYYRRIVESQKNRLLDEVIRVSKVLGVSSDDIEAFEKAKLEPQFNKAVDQIRDVVPKALLIKGHNPFVLLHGALSEGLHADGDQECLQLAHDIRVLLFEFSERIRDALKDQSELNSALSRLLQKGS